MSDKQVSFFAGANTPGGFVSLFDGLYDAYGDWNVYIIKGGPGTGKSGLMKKVAAGVEREGVFVERLNCSSDPASLDAIRMPELHTCILDGTAPHAMDPKFPGAVEEILNLGEFWDAEQLKRQAGAIRKTAALNQEMHRRSSRFLSAAGTLLEENKRLIAPSVDIDKIRNYAARFAAREFGKPGGAIGTEHRRYLSGITPAGNLIQYHTLPLLCDRIIALDDAYGAVSRYLIRLIRSYALASGLDVISCLCPMSVNQDIEHLLIPQTGLALFTENAFHTLPFDPSRRIHARRFTNMEQVEEHRCRLKFNRRAATQLIDESISLLKNAKEIHDRLEKFYIPAMNFEQVDALAQDLIERLLS